MFIEDRGGAPQSYFALSADPFTVRKFDLFANPFALPEPQQPYFVKDIIIQFPAK